MQIHQILLFAKPYFELPFFYDKNLYNIFFVQDCSRSCSEFTIKLTTESAYCHHHIKCPGVLNGEKINTLDNMKEKPI